METNYSEEKRAKSAAGAKAEQTHQVTEGDLKLCIKALTIASSSLKRFLDESGDNLILSERMRRTELIQKFQELSQKMQNL